MTVITQKKVLGHSVNYTNLKFTIPNERFLSSISINLPQPLSEPPAWNNVIHVIIELFHNKSDIITSTAAIIRGNPEILFKGWVRHSAAEESTTNIVLNKWISTTDLSTIQIRCYNLSNTTADSIPAVFKLFYYDRIFVQANNYDPEENRGVYAFDKKLIQNGANGTLTLVFAPQPGTWVDLRSIFIQPTFSAGESITVFILDQNTANIKAMIYDSSISTNFLEGPGQHVMTDDTESSDGAVNGGLGVTYPKMRIQYPDVLRFAISSVPQNDTCIIRVRFGLKSVVPETTVGGTGTPAFVNIATYALQYEKVI